MSDPMGKRALFSNPTPGAAKKRDHEDNEDLDDDAHAAADLDTEPELVLEADDVIDADTGEVTSSGRGKRDLYSGADAAGPTVSVECSNCQASVPLPLSGVVRQALTPGAWWLPNKRHSRRIRCTACGEKTWCRINWTSALR